jgi:hypothetical protein
MTKTFVCAGNSPAGETVEGSRSQFFPIRRDEFLLATWRLAFRTTEVHIWAAERKEPR